jgi:hypothetical protein
MSILFAQLQKCVEYIYNMATHEVLFFFSLNPKKQGAGITMMKQYVRRDEASAFDITKLS